MANDAKYQEILQKVLGELTTGKLQAFQEQLIKGFQEGYAPIPKDQIENKTLADTLTLLVKTFGNSGAAKVIELTLGQMIQNNIEEPLKKDGLISKVPYDHPLPDGLKSQTLITIYGKCEPTVTSFQINFMKGADIALHFNPRFEDKSIRRIARVGQNSTAEQKDTPYFPFVPGQPFELKILCTSNEFQVDADHKRVLTFAHVIKELEAIKVIHFEGQINISHVVVGRAVI